MSADAAVVRSTDETGELRRRALGTTFDLMRDILADPSILDDIPDGVTLVLIPDDDPELAEAEVELGMAALRRGEDVYFRHARRVEPENVWEAALRLEREYGAVWDRLKAGETTGEEASDEALVVLNDTSMDALLLATRRTKIRNERVTERTGVPGSPAIAAMHKLLAELRETVGPWRQPADAENFQQRMDAIMDDLETEIRQELGSGAPPPGSETERVDS